MLLVVQQTITSSQKRSVGAASDKSYPSSYIKESSDRGYTKMDVDKTDGTTGVDDNSANSKSNCSVRGSSLESTSSNVCEASCTANAMASNCEMEFPATTTSNLTLKSCDGGSSKLSNKRSASGLLYDNVPCPVCNKIIRFKKNLKQHINQHGESHHSITNKKYLDGVCIDESSGLHFINESFHGIMHPIHVRKLTTPLGGQNLECESNGCRM